MPRLPMFVEVLQSTETASLQICRKVMKRLFQRKVAPLPFGASVGEIQPVLASLRQKGTPPAIFIINTLWAEELVLQLDPLIGSTPVLFFNRQIMLKSDTSGAGLAAVGNAPKTTIFSNLTSRPMTVWGYGSKTADEISERAAQGLVQFLANGNFEQLMRLSNQNAAYEQALSVAQQNIDQFRAFEEHPSKALAFAVGVEPAPAAGRGFHGSLQQMSLPSLLIILEMEKKSGELVLTRPGELTRLYLSKGRVVAAYVEGEVAPAANRTGAESIYYALSWIAGLFDFVQHDVDMEDKINAPITSLLMEGARRMDELRTAGPNPG